MSGPPDDLVRELLAQSFIAWGIAGCAVSESGGALSIAGGAKDIHIDRGPAGAVFRWMVTIDGRKRGALSLVAVLRQVRETLDPGYAANRVRIAAAPLVPSQ